MCRTLPRPWFVALVSALLIGLGTRPAIAADPALRTMLDGHELYFDVAPLLDSGRTLVPVRGILEPLGAEVRWDASSRSVTAVLGATEVRVVIGERIATVNGEPQPLDAAPRIVSDRTLIPLRFFAESLGIRVGWEEETRTIVLQSRSGALASRDGTTAERQGSAFAAAARKHIGVPYAWGGTSPQTGFDCSGFIDYLGTQFGLDLPRTSYDQFQSGVSVARANLIPGDLVFFTTYAPGASHAGVYVGQGQFIHAGSESRGVQMTPLASVYWSERYLGARRVLR